jgi:hypothetical protein
MSKTFDSKIQKRVQAFVEHMLQYTIRLARLNAELKPIEGAASGFILNREGSQYLMSAGHVFRSGGDWGIETDVVVSGETVVIPVSSIQLISRITLDSSEGAVDAFQALLATSEVIELAEIQKYCSDPSASPEPLDIAWTELSIAKLRETLSADDRLKDVTWSLPAYTGPVDVEPSSSEPYGFAAYSRVEFHQDISRLLREEAYEVGMQFVGIDPKHDLYKFKLARNHQGDAYYKGSSGAPIADPTGKIVAIVVCGSEADNIIYGFPINRIGNLLNLERAPEKV